MKKITLPIGILTVVLSGLTPSLLFGQSVGGAQIAGVITDPSGAVIAEAQVKAVQTNTGQIRSTVSSSNGSYVLPNLAVGPYSLEVAIQGFERYVNSGIILEVGNQVTVNVALRLGDTSQAVQVSADAAMVQTQDTSVSEVVDQRRIIDLPLNGRQATDLILLAGGATKVPTASFGGANALVTTKNYPGSAAVSVGGGQATGNNYVMDGADNNDTFSNVNLPFPFPDALQEFSVQTNGLSAQFGIHPGTVVNVITKAGSNRFHGDLFEFVRNGDFNARNFLCGHSGYAPPQSVRRNDRRTHQERQAVRHSSAISGHASGRLHRNRSALSPRRRRSMAISAGWSRPRASPLVRTGRSPIRRQGNRFQTTRSPSACLVLKRLTWQNIFPSPRAHAARLPMPFLTRATRASISAAWIGTAEFEEHLLFPILPVELQQPAAVRRQEWLDHDTRRAGCAIPVVGARRQLQHQPVNREYGPHHRDPAARQPIGGVQPLLTLPTPASISIEYDPHFINLSVSGGFAFGCGNCATAHFNRNVFQFSDSVDIIHGRHQISIGADYGRLQFNEFNLLDANGTISFNGQVTKDPLLDFLLGKPNSLTQIQPDGMAFRQNYIGSLWPG